MKTGSLLDDGRETLNERRARVCCGQKGRLTLGHLVPRVAGGLDARNLVRACRSCNTSKGGRDLLVQDERNEMFPRLLVSRRDLKLIARACQELQALDRTPDELAAKPLTFAVSSLPVRFPPLDVMRL